MKKIKKEHITLMYNTCILTDEETEIPATVFSIRDNYDILEYTDKEPKTFFLNGFNNQNNTPFGYFDTNEYIKIDYELLKKEIDIYDGDFCFDLDIFHLNKKVGKVSLTGLMTYNKLDILNFIDNESPQSLDIAHYLLDNFENIKDKFIAIYDCFTLDEKYRNIGIEECIIEYLDNFLICLDFDISKIYMKSISNAQTDYCKDVPSQEIRTILENRGYKAINKNSQIMCFDFDEEYEESFILFNSKEELEQYINKNNYESTEG